MGVYERTGALNHSDQGIVSSSEMNRCELGQFTDDSESVSSFIN